MSLLAASNDILDGGVSAYGSATHVPNHDVGRLSYYLKCCVFGCGIHVNLPIEFMDYSNVHHFPYILQQAIVRLAFEEFRLDRLLNRMIFVDDESKFLPRHTSNIFYKVYTAFDMMPMIRPHLLLNQHLPDGGSVMICTSDWLNEFYTLPFLRYRGLPGTVSVGGSTRSPAVHDEDLANRPSQANEEVYCLPVHRYIRCDCCNMAHIRGTRYRCLVCENFDYCEACYYTANEGHDDKHAFERIAEEGSTPEPLGIRNQSVSINTEEGEQQDIPMAVAIRIDVGPPIAFEDHDTAAFASVQWAAYLR
jgi:hypothetical protein